LGRQESLSFDSTGKVGVHSGGPVPDLHGVPFSARNGHLEHIDKNFYIRAPLVSRSKRRGFLLKMPLLYEELFSRERQESLVGGM
jgi:hypothetical protein